MPDKDPPNSTTANPPRIGKTIAALSAGLPQGRILFLTNRRNQTAIVLQESRSISRKTRADIRTVAFQSKRSLCPLVRDDEIEYSDFIDFCEDKRKNNRCPYYRNVREGTIVSAIREASGRMPEEVYRIVSRRPYEMCPYEVLKEAAVGARIVVARYIHAFDDTMRGHLLEKILDKSETVCIVDEAHNLADEIAKHYSETITTRMTETALSELMGRAGYEEQVKFLTDLQDALYRNSSEKERIARRIDYTTGRSVEELRAAVDGLLRAGMAIREEKRRRNQKPTSYAHSIAKKYRKMILEKDERYILVTYTKKGYPVLELRCIDARERTSKTLEMFGSAVLMSATMTPTRYHAETLGIDGDGTVEMEYPPIFPAENRRIVIDTGTTTAYRTRTDGMYRKIARYVNTIIKETPGAAAVFYPSYGFLQKIVRRLGRHDAWIETPRSTITQFHREKGERTVLHAVASGKFGEGIDEPGYFKAACVVGVPLATWTEVIKRKIQYYEKLYPGRGRLYAYEIPAVNRVVQCAGRAIRTEEDRAVIVAMDSRLVTRYFQYLPEYWKREHVRTSSPEEVAEEIRRFWS